MSNMSEFFNVWFTLLPNGKKYAIRVGIQIIIDFGQHISEIIWLFKVRS